MNLTISSLDGKLELLKNKFYKMNKLNYLLVSVISVFLVGNIFLYSKLNKQDSNIIKSISELKQVQVNQNESIENLQNLITFNWKEYRNDQFGFRFKKPEYTNICDYTLTHNELAETTKEMKKVELRIAVGSDSKIGSCITGYTSSIEITVTKKVNNYKTAEEAFYGEFTNVDKPLNKHLGYLKKMGIPDVYGGNIVNESPDERVIKAENYGIIVLNDGYIIKVSDNEYEYIFNDMQLGNKPIFDAIISTLYFEQPIL